jgi:hypothetical protein
MGDSYRFIMISSVVVVSSNGVVVHQVGCMVARSPHQYRSAMCESLFQCEMSTIALEDSVIALS